MDVISLIIFTWFYLLVGYGASHACEKQGVYETPYGWLLIWPALIGERLYKLTEGKRDK